MRTWLVIPMLSPSRLNQFCRRMPSYLIGSFVTKESQFIYNKRWDTYAASPPMPRCASRRAESPRPRSTHRQLRQFERCRTVRACRSCSVTRVSWSGRWQVYKLLMALPWREIAKTKIGDRDANHPYDVFVQHTCPMTSFQSKDWIRWKNKEATLMGYQCIQRRINWKSKAPSTLAVVFWGSNFSIRTLTRAWLMPPSSKSPSFDDNALDDARACTEGVFCLLYKLTLLYFDNVIKSHKRDQLPLGWKHVHTGRHVYNATQQLHIQSRSQGRVEQWHTVG